MEKLNLQSRIVVIMLSAYTLLQVYCINKLSVNYDEPSFAAYGITILKLQGKKDIKEFDSKLPITALNMLPRAAEQVLHPGRSKSWTEAEKDIIKGRYISLLVTILLGLLIFRWTRELYGNKPALCALIFYLLCPNFLAHGIFVSSDIYACLFLTSSIYYLWKFRQTFNLKHFLLFSLSVALAQVSKFSMIYLFLIVPLLLIFTRRRDDSDNKRKIKGGYLFLLFVMINWFVISAAHFFYREFLFIGDYSFISATFKKLQDFLGNAAAYLPVPLPSSYLASMDVVLYFDQLGGGVPGSLNGEPYILSEHSRFGFWYYYFVSIFFKVPIATICIWLGSLALLFWRKTNFLKNELFLLLPVLYYLFQLNFFYTSQVGIRHLIIIFPFLFVLSGKLSSYIFEKKKSLILFFFIGWQFISVVCYFPHFLPYTNEFILSKKNAYKKIADSNLCYGEGQAYLKNYLQKNKDAIYMPDRPVAGKVVMEVNEMLNMNIATIGKYDWVNNLEPVDHIHSQYLVFDVSQAMADSLIKLEH